MVHKKNPSKRVTTRLRAKNTKRAAEKKRKDKKEARINPQSKKIKKDPGIPNLWPFKEKLIQEIEKSKQDKESERAAAKEKQKKNSLLNMVNEANKRSEAFNKQVKNNEEDEMSAMDPALVGKKDNSRKAYFREFKKVIDNSDVILEVLDARDPLGCRTRNIEKLILNYPNKRIILILNKIDLIPQDIANQWILYLRNEFPTIAFKASTQNQRTNISQKKGHLKNKTMDEVTSTSSSLGADSLIKLLKNYSRSQNIKTSLTVGVIGYPNVGKSSLINSLKRSKVCGVGASPGFTKVAQEIHLDAKLKLFDCPGIVFGGSQANMNPGDLLLRNCIKVELLQDPISPVDYLLKKCGAQNLMMHYSLPAFRDVKGFLVELARQRGFIKKGGVPDIEGVAKLVLKDWNSGNISFYTLPPEKKQSATSSSELVTAWSKEFSLQDYDESVSADNSIASKNNNKAMVMESTFGEVENEIENEFLEEMNMAEVIDDDDAISANDDSEEEEDEEEEEVEVNKMIMTVSTKSKKTGGVEKKITASEISIDSQLNQTIKKQMKQKNKALRKQNQRAEELLEMMEEEEEVMGSDSDEDNDDFDFAQLDGGLPMED
ncbi:P-loop containing nucleoside triphosphate hydrolase protein [Neoconidiobolus thromboides FSU 785]|nr:P-loop containing nucleoside triphosphate hydrolase protein [Neoconidiobolus thromboides FSU 785]